MLNFSDGSANNPIDLDSAESMSENAMDQSFEPILKAGKHIQLCLRDLNDDCKSILVNRDMHSPLDESLPLKRPREFVTRDEFEYRSEDNQATQGYRYLIEPWYSVDSEVETLFRQIERQGKEPEVISDTDSECIVLGKKYNIEEEQLDITMKRTISKQDRVKELVYSTLAKKKPRKKQLEYIPEYSMDYSQLNKDQNLLPSISDDVIEVHPLWEHHVNINIPENSDRPENIASTEITQNIESNEKPENVESIEGPEIYENISSIEIPQNLESFQYIESSEMPPNFENTEIHQNFECFQNIESTEMPQNLENTEIPQNIESTEMPQNLESIEIIESTEMPQNLESFQNIENTEIPQNIESLQNVENTEIPQNIESLQSIENIESTEIPQNFECFQSIDNTEIPQNIESLQNFENTEIPQNFECFQNIDNTEIPQNLENFQSIDNTEIPQNFECFQNIDNTEIPQNLESFQSIEDIESSEIPQNIERTEIPQNLESTNKPEYTNLIESEHIQEMQIIDAEEPQQVKSVDISVSPSLENLIKNISDDPLLLPPSPSPAPIQNEEYPEDDLTISNQDLSKMNISLLVSTYFQNHKMHLKSVPEECEDISMNICRVYVDNDLIAEVMNVSRNKAKCLALMRALSHFAPKLAERWREVNKESPYLRLLNNE